jgi:hypothetical protein
VPIRLSYAPELDGAAHPGEVVWTRVALEEDPARHKDRPVLVVGRKDAHTVPTVGCGALRLAVSAHAR